MKLTRHLLSIVFAALLFAPSLASNAQRRRTNAPVTGQKPAAQAPTPATRRTATGAVKVAPSTAASAPIEPDECGCEPVPLPEVLATVNGINVTRGEISPETQENIRQIKQQVIEIRREKLGEIVNEKLAAFEAKKRGISTAQLLETEVFSKVSEPTDADARAFYDQNSARIGADYDSAKADILGYLRFQRRQDRAQKFMDGLRASHQVKILADKFMPPTSDAERARVLANVNGEAVTAGDVEESMRALVYQAQDQIYLLRKQEVDARVNNQLFAQEAAKRGTSVAALLDAEITSKVPLVTESDAQKFYNENKGRIGNAPFAQAKYQIIQHLEGQARLRATTAFTQRLRNASSVQTFLRPPEAPVFDISTDDQPAKGNPTASVTIVEFTDYQCPSCAQTQPVIERLAAEYGDRVRIVMRDFPLEQHEHAFKAAEAAEAAREQGKYWEYVAILFRNQSALSVARLKEYAGHLGLDRARFDAALDSGKFAEKVQRDIADGQRLGVNSTPSIFVNGRYTSDRTYEGLKIIIEDALKPRPKD